MKSCSSNVWFFFQMSENIKLILCHILSNWKIKCCSQKWQQRWCSHKTSEMDFFTMFFWARIKICSILMEWLCIERQNSRKTNSPFEVQIVFKQWHCVQFLNHQNLWKMKCTRDCVIATTKEKVSWMRKKCECE